MATDPAGVVLARDDGLIYVPGAVPITRGLVETAERELAQAYDEYANLEAETLRIAERAGARRKELAEVPERIAGAIVNMPGPEAPDSYAVSAWYDGYERAVEDAARTAREWKAADGG